MTKSASGRLRRSDSRGLSRSTSRGLRGELLIDDAHGDNQSARDVATSLHALTYRVTEITARVAEDVAALRSAMGANAASVKHLKDLQLVSAF